MPTINWSERKESLRVKIDVMKHFISKTKDLVKKGAMQKELAKIQVDFDKSDFMSKLTTIK